METCKVEFICDSGQKIVFDFNLDESGTLEYKPHFEPKLTDPKTELGLAGLLCEMFVKSLLDKKKEDYMSIENGKSKRKLES